jgi:hypothetical protein
MAIIGQGVQAGLGRVDYTPYLQGAMAGAQGIAQGINAVSQAVATGVKDYYRKQEEKQKEKDAVTFMTTFINNNPQIASTLGVSTNLKGEVEDPGVVKAMIKSLGGADRAISIGTSLQQFQQSQQAFAMQQEAAARQAEMDALQIEKARQAMKSQEAATKAATAAFAPVEETVPSVEFKYAAPRPVLTEFLYGSRPRSDIKVPDEFKDRFLKDESGKPDVRAIDFSAETQRSAQYLSKRQKFVDEIERLSQQRSAVPSVSSFATMRSSSAKATEDADRAILEKINTAKINLENIDSQERQRSARFREFLQQKPSFKQGVDALPPNAFVDKVASIVNKTVKRDASAEEKLSTFMSKYLQEGGSVTPDFIDNVRKAFRSDVETFDVGDGVTVIRVGNSVNTIDRGKKVSVQEMDRLKAENYQSILNQLAAKTDWNGLPLELRQVVSAMAAAHEKQQNLMGARMSGQEAFDARRQELMGSGAARSGAPATPAARPVAKPMGMPSGWSVR